MEGSIVIFRILKKRGLTRTSRFGKLFYGYTDWSNRGRYKYPRLGLLGTIPHIRLIRGVIIVNKDDAPKVISFLKKHGAEFYMRTVILAPEDENTLLKREAHSEE